MFTGCRENNLHVYVIMSFLLNVSSQAVLNALMSLSLYDEKCNSKYVCKNPSSSSFPKLKKNECSSDFMAKVKQCSIGNSIIDESTHTNREF